MKSFGKLLIVLIFALGPNAFASMKGPTGLAVDSSGNLYVSNFSANTVQVYNASHQLTRTLSSELSQPYGVAVDAAQNLFVANFGNGTVTSYNSKGKALTQIVTGLTNPLNLAVDELDDLWVIDNGLARLSVYDRFGNVVRTFTASGLMKGSVFYGVAERSGILSLADDAANNLELFPTALTMAGVSTIGEVTPIQATPVAVAIDSRLGEWVAASDGSIYLSTNFRTYSLIVKLAYSPGGIAVDQTRKLVYVSNDRGNSVDVYTTVGVYVTTIN